ncbi:MAG: hypothetical protein ACYC9Z_18740 [Casimicrobiaceae bacterium]
MRIEFARGALRQFEQASSWWQEYTSAPFLFDDEFEGALLLLLSMPKVGIPCPTRKRPHLRRILLVKTEYHVYFSLERDESVIVIHSVWGARRGRVPKL